MLLVLRADPLLFVFSAAFGLLSGGMGAVILFLINRVAADYVRAGEALVPFLLCLLVFLGSEILAQFLVIRISQNSIFELRNKIIANVLSRPYKFSEGRAAEILSALGDDVSTITQSIRGIPVLLTNGALIIGGTLYMVWISWQLAMVFFLVVATGVGAFFLMRRGAGSHFVISRKLQDRLFDHFQTISRSLKEFKLNSQLQNTFLEKDFVPTAHDFRGSNIKAYNMFLASGSVGRSSFFVMIALLLFVVRDYMSVTDVQITSFVFAVIFIKGPIEWIFNWLPALKRARVALDELKKFGSDKGSGDLRVPEPAPFEIEKISVTDLVFQYPMGPAQDAFEVGPINIEFGRGVHFLVGGNGSGKTTFAKLLSGLYFPDGGTLEINDGQAITRADMAGYRQSIGAIFQNVSVLSRLNVKSPNDQWRFEMYLELFDLAEKVRLVDDSFSITRELSLGQQKRLALISSLVYDRPVYVFDEWAADQDPRFRSIFYTSILADLKRQNKIAIVISHDEGFYHVADQIIRFEYGKQVLYEPFENSVGQILIKRGLIDSLQLELALEEQRNSRLQEKLGEVIVRMGYASADTVRAALVAQLGLGQIFIEMGLITEEQLVLALREQKLSRTGTRIGEILQQMGLISEADVEKALRMKDLPN